MSTNVAVIVSIIVGSIFARNVHAQNLFDTHQQSFAHPAVILNAQMESQLPAELIRSNKFYSNPSVAHGLAHESWLTNKEMVVSERAAEKIPRSEIYKIVKSAGFIRRRRFI